MFGIRIQESLDYQVTMVAGWCIQPFDWTPACDRQTDRQTVTYVGTAYHLRTCISYASRSKNNTHTWTHNIQHTLRTCRAKFRSDSSSSIL